MELILVGLVSLGTYGVGVWIGWRVGRRERRVRQGARDLRARRRADELVRRVVRGGRN